MIKTTKTRKRPRRWLLPLLAALLLGLLAFRAGVHRFALAEYPRKYSEYVDYYAGKYGLDPLLVYAFIRTESGFDASAQSGVDARGLMQMTDETFAWIKSKIAPTEGCSFDDLYDPELNIRFGTYYLHICLDRYGGHLPTAAAAYHSGWGTVDRLLAQPEYSADGSSLEEFPYTQMKRYVTKIDRNYTAYRQLYEEAGG